MGVRKLYQLVICLTLLLAACGCGDGDTTRPDDTTPSPVSSTVPPDGATNVEVDAFITTVFIEDIDPSSITDTTFTLSYNPLVPGTVTYYSGAKTATFTPDTDLSYSTTYTTTITAEVMGLAGMGSPMTIVYTWSFTTIAFRTSLVDPPRTGQITSYATEDDGDIGSGIAWPTPRFTDNVDGTITDELTGLMWLKDGNCLGFQNWQYGAFDRIDSLNINPDSCDCQDYTAEYTDWRLPNVNELESLINAGVPNSATWLNNLGFTNVQVLYYWSSTTFAYNTMSACNVHMWSGYVDWNDKNGARPVWAVRGVTTTPAQLWKTGQTTSHETGDDGDIQTGIAWPNPRFFLNLNVTVTDLLTGLNWVRGAETPTHGQCTGGMMTWQEALDYIACLNASGYHGCSDWRLPNRKELYSLIDHSNHSPPLPSGHDFMNVQLSYYWTSTTYAFDTSKAWIVGMQYGDVSPWDKTGVRYVWPVRGEQ